MHELWMAAQENLDNLNITNQIWVGMALFATFFAMAMRPPVMGGLEVKEDEHKVSANPYLS